MFARPTVAAVLKDRVLATASSARIRLSDATGAGTQWAERTLLEWGARSDAKEFAEVERFCQFVGFSRSGGTLVGAMLDAHPDLVIANEFDSLDKVARNYSRDALFASAMRIDRRFVARGFENQDDVYEIPGQWQGRVRRLRVVGDKYGGGTSVRLQADPSLLDRLADTIGIPLHVMVVVRNPFDNIARMATRGSTSLVRAAASYETMAIAVQQVLAGPYPVLVQYHEDTVADPSAALRRMASFLEVDAPDGWVEACAALVLPSPRIARTAVDWSPAQSLLVREMIDTFDFLGRYSSDDAGGMS